MHYSQSSCATIDNGVVLKNQENSENRLLFLKDISLVAMETVVDICKVFLVHNDSTPSGLQCWYHG